ncbi:LysM peptidoglycan-binding domain-containing protein [Microbacterium indicum]|uniref:LysM peptidoglycan-binding domain-containing protein n=1 Tax=Microbacterium indicum TaxID=358100 RepID=UPI00068515C2|nr:LysM peptidoglycan-binding domain-containing protein [Microbacterium indicum]
MTKTTQPTAVPRAAAVPIAISGALALTLGAAPAFAADDAPRAADAKRAGSPLRLVSASAPVQPATAEVETGYASGASGSSPTYTVQEGDTATGIAIRQGLRTVDLLSWNGLSWSSTIYPGQELTLRAPGSGSADAQPASSAGAASSGATGSATNHTVAAGETLWSISQKYGTTVAALTSANDLGANALIFPGQELSLTASSGHAATPAAAVATPAASTGSSSSSGSVTVAAGDTLWAIAAAHDLSVDELLSINSLSASSIIYPGQSLTVAKPQAAPASTSSSGSSSSGSIYDSSTYDLSASLNAPQAENAALIIGVGRSVGASDTAIAIALATAMVESGLRNLDHGDRDSVGLFQQRPSQGWGEAEQLNDRGYATRVFFQGSDDGSARGLYDISGWDSMSFGEAAQAVQISAFPDRYDRWRSAAYGWLATYG